MTEALTTESAGDSIEAERMMGAPRRPCEAIRRGFASSFLG